MIIGSGMLATAFREIAHDEICIYAAGVSNSACTLQDEFLRETQRLTRTLEEFPSKLFVYFSTCSIADATAQTSAYVLHKKQIERLIQSRGNYLLLRLPQIAGQTSNPNTLLNYLATNILNDTPFQIWNNASRNIIDVDHVVAIGKEIFGNLEFRNLTINIANPRSASTFEIVSALERIYKKNADYTFVEKGAKYHIDVSAISAIASDLQIDFENDYLDRTLEKYYGRARE